MTEDEIRRVGEALWAEMQEYTSAKRVLRDDPDPYKGYYRASTILAMMDPPHFKVLGEACRRVLTGEEAFAILLSCHSYFPAKMGFREKAHFLELYEEFSGPDFWELPEEWGKE